MGKNHFLINYRQFIDNLVKKKKKKNLLSDKTTGTLLNLARYRKGAVPQREEKTLSKFGYLSKHISCK